MLLPSDCPCPFCKGEVIYTSNAYIYGGRTYGSGMCYVCTNCKASVGTHENNPKKPFGVLANKEMKLLKQKCHAMFDPIWKSRQIHRSNLYKKLAYKLEITLDECHFGMFDTEMLNKAINIMSVNNWWQIKTT